MKDLPRYSVCIATFNGGKYIRQQLLTILLQLDGNCEIIISDDSSTDNTLAEIEIIGDPRIRILRNQTFSNPIYNFENCISHAAGGIIFMSDQDDLWHPHKVEAMSEVFRNNPDVTLVASDAQIINEKSELVSDTFYPSRAKFSSGVIQNIVKNRFLGCTLAFRRSILDVILPFPPHLPMHDSWIGILNQLYGRVYFVNVPLILYRRHSQNFTSSTHAGLIQMLIWRLRLVIAILGRIWKCRARKIVV